MKNLICDLKCQTNTINFLVHCKKSYSRVKFIEMIHDTLFLPVQSDPKEVANRFLLLVNIICDHLEVDQYTLECLTDALKIREEQFRVIFRKKEQKQEMTFKAFTQIDLLRKIGQFKRNMGISSYTHEFCMI